MNKDITTSETSKEDFNKQIIEKRNETSELSVRLKTEIEPGNKTKSLSKDNKDDIKKLKESENMQKVIEEEKERMTSYRKEDIKKLSIKLQKELVILIPIFE